jgi:hypothetical protein
MRSCSRVLSKQGNCVRYVERLRKMKMRDMRFTREFADRVPEQWRFTSGDESGLYKSQGRYILVGLLGKDGK